MMVRRLFFFSCSLYSHTRESVNAVSPFPFTLPLSLPLASLSLSHHVYLCSVLLIIPLPSSSSVSVPVLSVHPPCLFISFLFHLTPPPHIHARTHTWATCCLCPCEQFGRKRMTQADFYFSDCTNYVWSITVALLCSGITLSDRYLLPLNR